MSSLAKRIAEGSIILTFRTLFVRIIGILITIILVRSLGKFDYGLYALFMSAVGIASIFLIGNLGNVVVADVSQELQNGKKERAKALLVGYSQFTMILTLFISFVLLLLSIPVLWHYGPKVRDLVVIIALIIPLYGITNILNIIFHAHARFDNMALISMMDAIGRLAFVVVAVVVLDYGLMGAAYSQLFGPLLSVLVAFYPAISTVRYLKDIHRPRIGLFYSMLHGHGKYMIAMRPVNQLKEQGLPWVVQFFLGVEAVAVFTVAKRGMEFFNTILFSINQVYLPLLSAEVAKGVERVNQIVTRSTKYLLISSSMIVLGGVIIAPFVFKTLFGIDYLESVPIFRLILLTLFVISFGTILGPVFMAYKGQKYTFYASLISLATMLILVSLLTPAAGLVGTAVGYLGGVLVQTALLYYYLKRIHPDLKVEFSSMFTVDDYDRQLLKKMYSKLKK